MRCLPRCLPQNQACSSSSRSSSRSSKTEGREIPSSRPISIGEKPFETGIAIVRRIAWARSKSIVQLISDTAAIGGALGVDHKTIHNDLASTDAQTCFHPSLPAGE